jgi:flagellar hook-associated protein 2
MSSIQLPGLLTGLDSGKLISQLMAIERRKVTLYENRKEVWEGRQDDLNTLETKLTTLQSSISALSDAGELRSFSAKTSDSEVITAEASQNAFEGNHNVVVSQLASAERWIHTTGLKYTEDYVGQGNFIYSYNNKETVITTTETTTLEDLVGLINNDANNPGITAGFLYYNNAYHLVLNGNDAGTDYRISVNSSSTELWQSQSRFTVDGDNATLGTEITELDQFGSSPLQGGEVIEITGTDHAGNAIAQVNLSVTGYTKISHIIDEINDAFDGIATAAFENGKIVFTDKASGSSSLSINLAFNANGSSAELSMPSMAVVTEGGGTVASLASFATTDFTMTQAAKDSLIKIDGFPSSDAAGEVQTASLSPPAESGTYTLTYEGQTTAAIAYNASPAEIQAALVALSSLNPGDITVGGPTGGLNEGPLTFTFSDTLGDVSKVSLNPANLGPAGLTAAVDETIKGIPAYISRSSNTVDDVIPGVTLHLHETTDENGIEVTLTRDIQTVKNRLNAMVEAYNSVISFVREKTGYNESTKTAGTLMSDYTVSSVKSQLSTLFITQTKGFLTDLDSFLMPAQLGFELDKDGKLSLDSTVLDEAISKDYMDVLALIGADKTGSSNSNTIKFYGASSKYTTAGNYDVEVIVSDGAITSARIKLAGESTYRDAAFSGNIITGFSSFENNGNPVYAENGLQLSVDLSINGTYTADVWVKQGFAGAIEDALDRMLKTTSGSIQIDQEHVKDQIDALAERIEVEEERLEKKEEKLVARYATLEKTLALLQSQMSALGLNSS